MILSEIQKNLGWLLMEQSKYWGAGSSCLASLEVLCYLCKSGIKVFEFTRTCHSPETVESLPIITHSFLMTHNALQPPCALCFQGGPCASCVQIKMCLVSAACRVSVTFHILYP